MSATATPDPPPLPYPPVVPATTVTRPAHAASHKSYRRKYRKIMVKFEKTMQQSHALYKDEQRLLEVSTRLTEQTDQMLQLLVDLNSCPQIPRRLRFDLADETSVPDISIKDEAPVKDEEDAEIDHLALRKARYQLQTGEISAERYESIKDSLMKEPSFAPAAAYSDLTKLAPRVVDSRPDENDPVLSELNGLVTLKHEEDYTHTLDAFISGAISTPRRRPMVNRDKDAQMHNPVSVYNWLKGNQPGVFAQEHDNAEKPSRMTGARSSKRNANRESIIKQEQDMYDEDGIALEPGPSRGKRKRDDDGGYRPKGGNSRPTKRKKEDGGSISKRGKKLSIDAR